MAIALMLRLSATVSVTFLRPKQKSHDFRSCYQPKSQRAGFVIDYAHPNSFSFVLE